MDITALIHDCSVEGESGFAASSVEFPEANGQGETVEESLANLYSATEEVLAYRREVAAASLGRGERLERLST